ncbi:DUF2000 domain-containing protein [Geitlerinema sp. CS-897]|uniref:DUF2000 domain-containing protein n=1 Tax=Baaleninema simplex TaxID=2862350 RepID=UPI00036BF784|nr:DUF2000 domain-containing protein [Baaleninema simplex]MDC0833066.1 DUF2000 domain-containing protein [Geitlerinema sp. CS-897]
MKIEPSKTKCVTIVDADLPTGLIANTAAVLSLTLGAKIEGIIGSDLYDMSGRIHVGITTVPIPILKADREQIKEIRNKLYEEDFLDFFVVDFSDVAQSTKNYEDYSQKISQHPTEELRYLGIAVLGNKKKVSKLTGNMPLLR